MTDRNRNNNKKSGKTNEDQDHTPVHLTSDSTLQSPEEHEHDRSIDPNKDRDISVSRDDLHEINAGRITGRESRDERDIRNDSEK